MRIAVPISSFRLLRVSQSVTCRQIRSKTLRQQLEKYAANSLPVRNWEMGIFVCYLCGELEAISAKECSLTHLKIASLNLKLI